MGCQEQAGWLTSQNQELLVQLESAPRKRGRGRWRKTPMSNSDLLMPMRTLMGAYAHAHMRGLPRGLGYLGGHWATPHTFKLISSTSIQGN